MRTASFCAEPPLGCPAASGVRKADARKRKALLNDREKKRQEGLLRKAPGGKRTASSPPAGAPAKKKKKLSKKSKGPSVAPDVRMALLAEEAASINQPGSAHPDEVADLPPVTPQQERWGQIARSCLYMSQALVLLCL
ncbi:uncharacterized protein LOC117925913 [Vitis riparia]|uniref:uncharacterized protein LOC117925913 n=1 Tax=Vitis riparia TaxID=96939 RepID=UPI00155AAC16|nr:uncharacterized protein LOC117925913 [Vitis riparia]